MMHITAACASAEVQLLVVGAVNATKWRNEAAAVGLSVYVVSR